MADQRTALVRSSPLKSALRLFNPPFTLILRSSLHGMLSKSFMLLAFKGRRSGREYTIPVGYLREGDELRVISPKGWWKNLRDGDTPVRMLLEGTWRSGVARATHGDEATLTGFARLVEKFPSLIRLHRLECDASGRPKPESLRRAASSLALVRIRLAAECEQASGVAEETGRPS